MLIYLNPYGGIYGLGVRLSESVGVLLTDDGCIGRPCRENDICHLNAIGERLYIDQLGRLLMETEYGYVGGSVTASSPVSLYSSSRLMNVGGAAFDYYSDGKCMRVNGMEVSYYCEGRLMRIGNTTVDYYGDGRVMRAGCATLDYFGDGRIMRIGSVGCEYYSDGRFMRIGYTSF